MSVDEQTLTAHLARPVAPGRAGRPSWRPERLPQREALAWVVLGLVTIVLVLVPLAGAPWALVRVTGWFLVPGWAIVRHLPIRSLPLRAAMVAAAGLCISSLIALAMVWTHHWAPVPASLAVLVIATASYWLRVSRPLDAGLPSPGLAVDSVIVAAAVGIAAVLWVIGLLTTSTDDLGDWGLLPAFSPFWWAGTAVAVAACAAVVVRPTIDRLVAAPAVALLVVILYGSADLLERVPRLPWVYKHIAVTTTIAATGAVDPTANLYMRWPGFFAASAWVQTFAGLGDPSDYVPFVGTLFALLNTLLVFAIARTVSADVRTAWVATLVFASTNWIGQNYYSPQAFAFVLYLTMCLIALQVLRGSPGRFGAWLEHRAIRLVRSRRTVPPLPVAGLGRTRTALAVGAMLVLQATATMSHQLTPYLAALSLAPLFLTGFLRPRWVAVPLVVIPLLFLLPNFDYIQSTYGLFSGFDFFANATYTPQNAVAVTAGQLAQGRVADLLVALVALLGVVGVLRTLRSRTPRTAVIVGWLIAAPALSLLVQTYGGEGRLRAYLFALPWLSIGAAWYLTVRRRRRAGRRIGIRSAVALVVFSALFVFVYFQPEGDVRIAPADYAAGLWLGNHAQRGDVVVGEIAVFPLSLGPGDSPHVSTATQDVATKLATVVATSPSSLSASQLSYYVRESGLDGRVFLVLSDQQERYERRHEAADVHPLTTLDREAPSEYPLVYSAGGTRVYLVQR